MGFKKEYPHHPCAIDAIDLQKSRGFHGVSVEKDRVQKLRSDLKALQLVHERVIDTAPGAAFMRELVGHPEREKDLRSLPEPLLKALL